MLTPLKATAICQINKETKQVLSYSCIQLAIASPYAIDILYILAVACCLIVRKDSSKGSVDKLIKSN
jgi:hypothetical protein